MIRQSKLTRKKKLFLGWGDIIIWLAGNQTWGLNVTPSPLGTLQTKRAVLLTLQIVLAIKRFPTYSDLVTSFMNCPFAYIKMSLMDILQNWETMQNLRKFFYMSFCTYLLVWQWVIRKSNCISFSQIDKWQIIFEWVVWGCPLSLSLSLSLLITIIILYFLFSHSFSVSLLICLSLLSFWKMIL